MKANQMLLLTQPIIDALPPLYSTENTPLKDKKIIVRFFNPMGVGTWEIYEGSKQENEDWVFFGMCEVFEKELGYVTLEELESIGQYQPLGIERDICVGPRHFHPEWGNEEDNGLTAEEEDELEKKQMGH
jgi:hypothetical protein